MHGGSIGIGCNGHGKFVALNAHNPIIPHSALVIIHAPRDFRAANFTQAIHCCRAGADNFERLLWQFNPMKPLWILFFDKGSSDISSTKPRVIHHGRQEGNIVTNALNLKGVQRIAHLRDGRWTIGRPGAELGNHWIIEHGNFTTFIHTRIIADRRCCTAGFSRRTIPRQPPN